MPKFYTPRGFAMYEEIPYSNYEGEEVVKLTVQESSLATERRVWVGNEGLYRMHLTEDVARRLRDALTEFLGEAS